MTTQHVAPTHPSAADQTTLLIGGRVAIDGLGLAAWCESDAESDAESDSERASESASGPAATTAMMVRGDTVAWLGSDEDAHRHRDSADRVVHLAGRLVTPAFVDAHIHATSTGLLLTGLDLVGSKSLGEALDRVERYCRSTGSAGVVLGTGWDETLWPEARPPTREEIDRASYGACLYLTRIDVHSALASSAMLAMLPGIVDLDGYDPSGLLTREAHHRARAVALDSVTPSARTAAQRATRARCAELGVAAFHELGGPEISSPDDFRGVLALAAAELGPMVVGYWGELGGIDQAHELQALGAAGDLFADGAIGSHTASLRLDYADSSTRGSAYLTAAQVRDHFVACTRAGLQAGFHSIGDAAMDVVVSGCEEAAAVVGADALRAARHRIEHVEMLDADLISRMSTLGLFASVQPAFDELWGGTQGMYAERLGVERAVTLNPFAGMVAAGLPLALGSDSPVTPIAPWAAIRAAIHHHVPEQRLTLAQAFDAHTSGGWRAARNDEAGTLAVGSPATYAVWDCQDVPALVAGSDPLACQQTVLTGRVIFERQDAA